MTRHAAEQGAELVGRLLAFARRQQLTPGQRRHPTALCDVGRRPARPYARRAGPARMAARSESLAALMPTAAQLELALMNLIINARDAMPEGGTISVADRRMRARRRQSRSSLPAGDYVVHRASTTRAAAFPPTSSSRSPSPSSPPRRSARAPASACRWSTASPTSRAARCGSAAIPARERRSSFSSPQRRSPFRSEDAIRTGRSKAACGRQGGAAG